MCFRKFEGLVDMISMERGWYKKANGTYPISVRHFATCFIQFTSQKASCELSTATFMSC